LEPSPTSEERQDALEGIWRLVQADAQDAAGKPLDPPYGLHPIGTITFQRGRMLAVLCNGDALVPEGVARSYSSYGGAYRFDGGTLEVQVDIASDPSRIGGTQVRDVDHDGDRMQLRPPLRPYGKAPEQRTLSWQRIWRPSDGSTSSKEIDR
jgi:hypothetical protein